jgi:nucleoside-diphosphate-sugar epimerase
MARFLVTGANGYLASWIVAGLLAEGHEVHGTVRDRSKPRSYRHLEQLAHADRLSLFQADLLDPDAFAAPMAGCEYVVHTASPFQIRDVTDADAQLVRPAVTGVRNVLATATRTDSVRRVVMTSSTVAVYGDTIEARGRGPFTEADWNATSTAEHQPYPYSKVLAEKAAWELAARQDRWSLVTLLPGFILGPPLDPATAGVSNTMMRNLGDGTYRHGMIDLWYGIVDVRDVARAHVAACTRASAHGRYIISNRSASFVEIAGILRDTFGDRYPLLPKRKVPKPLAWLMASSLGMTRAYIARNVGYPIELDNRRSLTELGLRYTPLEITVVEHFRQVASERSAATAAAATAPG